jgi:hypothetical protein
MAMDAKVVGFAVALVVIVVIIVYVSLAGKSSSAKKQLQKAKRSIAPRGARSNSRAGSSPHSAYARAGNPMASAAGSSEFLVDGSTANSEQPMPSPENVSAMMFASSGAGEGPQTDAKLAARAAMNLSDGKGVVFSPEMMDRIENAADLEAAIRSDPQLAAEYAAVMERVSQRADVTGVNRAKPSRDEAQALSAVISDLNVPQQGQFGMRSGAASAVSQERFASAVGPSNLAQLAASRSQYDTLIAKTLVAPDDHLRQAALVAMVHKVSDPGQRARLMSKLSSLASAVFRDSASAEEGIRDGGTGYIGFTQQQPARGTTASLGARYSFGDGGDLMPILFNYGPPRNISREQIQSCGFATHQAYEFASGRDAGLSQA